MIPLVCVSEGFHERGPSPEHSSDSESDSESQSVSRSGSGTSSEGTSSDDDSEADSRSVTPAAEAASSRPGRASALCIRNLSMRSSGKSFQCVDVVFINSQATHSSEMTIYNFKTK